MTVTLKQLEAFVAVAKMGSFSAAAQAMHVSQPALTAMIQKLERQLGATLFNRESRGSSVTAVGRELFPTVERLVEELNETVADVLHRTTPRGGLVQVACIPSVAASLLPALLRGFEQEMPSARVVLKDAMPENRNIVDMVRAGEVDIGVAHASQDAQGLGFRPLFEDSLVALLPQGEAGRWGDVLRWTDLAGLRLIGMSHGSYVRQLVDESYARVGLASRPHAEVSLITTAVGMVRAGLGAAVLPATVTASCNMGGVAVRPLAEPEVRRPVGMLYRSMAELTPVAKRFLRFIEGAVKMQAADADAPWRQPRGAAGGGL